MTLGFTLPLYAFLAGQTALAAVLMLPMPLCKPGVVVIRFASTPVGKSISATAVRFDKRVWGAAYSDDIANF